MDMKDKVEEYERDLWDNFRRLYVFFFMLGVALSALLIWS